MAAGNQSPFLLINFEQINDLIKTRWESVTLPFDKLRQSSLRTFELLGISHPSF